MPPTLSTATLVTTTICVTTCGSPIVSSREYRPGPSIVSTAVMDPVVTGPTLQAIRRVRVAADIHPPPPSRDLPPTPKAQEGPRRAEPERGGSRKQGRTSPSVQERRSPRSAGAQGGASAIVDVVPIPPTPIIVTPPRQGPRGLAGGPMRGRSGPDGGTRGNARENVRETGDSTGARRTDGAARPVSRLTRAPRGANNGARREGVGGLAAERQRLIRRAESSSTGEELESLAAELAGFLGASKGEAPTRRFESRGSHRRSQRRRRRSATSDNAGVGVGGDGPGFHRGPRQVEEAKNIQALYRSNRKRAMQKILVESEGHCKVPLAEVDRYFRSMYSVPVAQVDEGGAVEWPVWAEGDNESLKSALEKPFSETEVNRRLRRAHNSSPGPDGLSYADLKKADPGCSVLTAVFNACLRLALIPASWKRSNTVLVHKGDDPQILSNWRPLAMGDTTAKLFAAVLADRLTEFATRGKRIGKEQKGFLQFEGCAEHNYVLQEAIDDSKRTGKELVVAWLDLSNAFGSVPHSSIYKALEGAGVPLSTRDLIKSMYTGCTTQVRTEEGFTTPIRIAAGVKQGCPASPITFNLTLESLIRAVSNTDAGYVMGSKRWSNLAYADDIALVASSKEEMELMLRTAESEAAKIGLKFNPSKCATLHLMGKASKQRARSTEFHMGGIPLRSMAAGDAYKHLGIPTGFQVKQTPTTTIEQLIVDVGEVDKSLLTPWQKLDAVATFILPRLDFVMRGANVRKTELTVADKVIKRTAKRWMNLPQRASPEVVFIPPFRGGGGLTPLADLADILTVAHAFRMLTCTDEPVRNLAETTLREVVQRGIKRVPSNRDIANYLSGNLEGEFALACAGSTSFWSRVRVSTRRGSARFGLRWRYDELKAQLSIECRGPKGATTIIPPSARAQVIPRLRRAIQEYYLHTLIAKPDQGKVYEVSSGVRPANHFMRTGGYTRFAEWRFIHRARLNVLPLNGARRWGSGDKRCRRCGHDLESLPHVLCHCTPHSAARQRRHDAIVTRMAKAIKLPGVVRINRRVPGIEDPNLNSLRPDLVIMDEASKTVHIVDITVPFENGRESFAIAREGKILKYSPLAHALHSRGYNVNVDAIIVGALGTWDPDNEPVLKRLHVSPWYASMMRRIIVSETIHWSRDIYVEHVSGIRQYAIPLPFDPTVGGGSAADRG